MERRRRVARPGYVFRSCTPLSASVDVRREHEGHVRLGWIDRAVDVAVRPVSDWAQYGLADFWASPLQTLANGAGDCEDYAILKYVALRELGILPDDLRLVIVQDDRHEVGHAVVAVRYEQRCVDSGQSYDGDPQR